MSFCIFFFFFNDTATTEIYTLSLHDALPILAGQPGELLQRRHAQRSEPLEQAVQHVDGGAGVVQGPVRGGGGGREDRKSTRLNSSHANISYAVFCLKKKKKKYR